MNEDFDIDDDFLSEQEETLKENFNPEKKDKKQKFLIKERYEIDFSEPIRWLDANGAEAFRVHDRVDGQRELFALVCSNQTAPRSSLLSYMKNLDHHSIMKLIEYGITSHALKKTKNLALIYPIPLGGKVISSKHKDLSLKGNNDKFKYTLLRLLSAVENLRGYKITHRAIRLDNLFYKDAARTEIILGDCIATFPAFYQPAIYETVESLTAQIEGRGNGDETNDIYAAGVAILSMYLGREPLSGTKASEVLKQKLKKGSYTALIGDEIISNQHANIFRGLLNDTPENRWTYVQTYNYLEGKTGAFQAIIHERPRKSITINGEKVNDIKEAVFAMQKSCEETYELIKNGKILDWVKNGIANENLTNKVKRIINNDLIMSTKPEIVVSKLCILLCPKLPIKLRNLSVFPDGASKAIFYAIKNNDTIEPFYTLFSSDLIKLWYQEQNNSRSPANTNELKIYISSKDIGYGMDRIIYDFDADLPCLSPLLGEDFINTSTKILQSLDNTFASHQIDSPPYDRNLIAYLRCKMGKKIDKVIANLNSSDDAKKAHAILRLYASMQNKYGPAELPNLSLWVSNYCKNIIKSYHNIKYQKYLEKELLKVNTDGKLNDIVKILEDEDAYKRDILDYNKAKREAAQLLLEKNNLINNDRQIYADARKLGLRVASIIAAVTMLSSLILNVIEWALK